jgi:hypothetical protein
MSDAVIARWDAFLDKTRTRATDLLAEASGACAQLIQGGECDANVVFAGWEAVSHRASDLANRVVETWNGQVVGAMEGAGVAGDRLEAERVKASAMRQWIELEIERTRLAIRCDLARETLKREAAEPRTDSCTRCGAPLDVPLVFITTNVTCGHCRAIVEYVPGTRTRMIAAHCMFDLPEMTAWPEYVVMKEAARAEDKRAHEAAQLVHGRKVLTTRAELLPNEAATFEADLRRACPFYKGPVVVPQVTPLSNMDDLRARMQKVLDAGFGIVSAPMTSLTSSIYANARADLLSYGTVKSGVDQMACTVCGAPRIKDDRDLRPCVYCGGALA